MESPLFQANPRRTSISLRCNGERPSSNNTFLKEGLRRTSRCVYQSICIPPKDSITAFSVPSDSPVLASTPPISFAKRPSCAEDRSHPFAYSPEDHSSLRAITQRFIPSIAVILVSKISVGYKGYCACRSSAPSIDQTSDGLRNELPGRVSVSYRVLPHIPIHAGTIDQPQRIRLHISARHRIVIAHPVLMHAGFRLEPLAGEADGGGGAGGGMDIAKGS